MTIFMRCLDPLRYRCMSGLCCGSLDFARRSGLETMQRLGTWLLPLLLSLAVATAAAAGPAPVKPALRPTDAPAACLADGGIPKDQRAGAEAAALGFVQQILGGDPAEAYGRFTPETQAGLSATQFNQLAAAARESLDAVHSLKVSHTYVVTGVGGGHDKRIACGGLAHPESLVIVATKPLPLQAHVVIEGSSANDGWAFVLWLVHGQDWQVQNVYLGTIGMVGKSAADLWHLARDQAKRRHLFNASLLYAAADGLAERGPDFELGIRPVLRREMARLKRPPALQDAPPVTWKLGTKSYRILLVAPVGVSGKLNLMINWETPPWQGDAEAEARNQAFIAAFLHSYPEYADSFTGLIVSAVETGGDRGFRSVHYGK
jgi:hypothetical protein